MSSFEYDQAKIELKETRRAILTYLKSTYNDKLEAEKTFKYLENVVTNIIKRHEYSINFGSGGNPLWHAKVLVLMSKWVEIENRLGKLISSRIESS
jgi:hypothetical protein